MKLKIKRHRNVSAPFALIAKKCLDTYTQITLVMGLYVIEDGKVSYIQHEGTYEDTVTKGGITLDVVTITKIAELTGIDLALPTPKAIPNKED